MQTSSGSRDHVEHYRALSGVQVEECAAWIATGRDAAEALSEDDEAAYSRLEGNAMMFLYVVRPRD